MASNFIQFFPAREIAITLGGFSIHWYGLLYLVAFVVAYLLLPKLQHHRGLSLSEDVWSDILAWSIGAVIIGGRLGYVFFYEPLTYLSHPWEIFAVWRGGMSSHGGFLAVVAVLFFLARKHRIPVRALGDLVVVPVAIGLMLGRIGNFINLELYGIETMLPWGIAIPGVEGLRHPTQLYAAGKDLFIAVVCCLHLRLPRRPHGETGALFLLLYGVLRFLIEFVRVPTHSSFDLGLFTLTRGQLYTLPIIVGGIVVLFWISMREKSKEQRA